MNHGAGRDAAMKHTKEHAERWLQDYADKHALPDWAADVFGNDHRQTSLL
jgi:hypothetical protein